MSKHSNEVTEIELHAFVDGQLDVDRVEAVERYLTNNPAKAKELEIWQNQNQSLRALFEPVMNEQIPNRLRPEAVQSLRTPGGTNWQSIAAALVLLAVGGATGWFSREIAEPNSAQASTFAEQAMTAHSVFAVEVRHPVEVTAKEQTHLVGWLSDRLGKPISAPDLNGLGFELIGGRLLPSTDGPAAQFMYEDDTGRRITLYAIGNKSKHLAAFRFFKEADYNAFYWLDTNISYAIVGNVPRKDLRKLATEAYQRLT